MACRADPFVIVGGPGKGGTVGQGWMDPLRLWRPRGPSDPGPETTATSPRPGGCLGLEAGRGYAICLLVFQEAAALGPDGEAMYRDSCVWSPCPPENGEWRMERILSIKAVD